MRWPCGILPPRASRPFVPHITHISRELSLHFSYSAFVLMGSLTLFVRVAMVTMRTLNNFDVAQFGALRN